jgi:hypothetical protein
MTIIKIIMIINKINIIIIITIIITIILCIYICDTFLYVCLSLNHILKHGVSQPVPSVCVCVGHRVILQGLVGSWLVNIQKAMENIGKSQFLVEHMDLTSGKHTTDYGKSPFYSWVNQLFSMAISNSYVKLPEGN